MSVVITTGDKSKEYFLNQVGNVCCGGGGSGSGGSGLYLGDGKIVDGDGKDVTKTVDTILAASVVVGDVIIDFEKSANGE